MEHKDTLINYRIAKAKETMEDAKIALENNRFRNTLNRIYYANFYIVSELAIKYDFSTSKHGALISWFNQNFVKPGKIPNGCRIEWLHG